MTKEEADAYFNNLYRIAHEIVEFMRRNELKYSETDRIFEYAKQEIGRQMGETKI